MPSLSRRPAPVLRLAVLLCFAATVDARRVRKSNTLWPGRKKSLLFPSLERGEAETRDKIQAMQCTEEVTSLKGDDGGGCNSKDGVTKLPVIDDDSAFKERATQLARCKTRYFCGATEKTTPGASPQIVDVKAFACVEKKWSKANLCARHYGLKESGIDDWTPCDGAAATAKCTENLETTWREGSLTLRDLGLADSSNLGEKLGSGAYGFVTEQLLPQGAVSKLTTEGKQTFGEGFQQDEIFGLLWVLADVSEESLGAMLNAVADHELGSVADYFRKSLGKAQASGGFYLIGKPEGASFLHLQTSTMPVKYRAKMNSWFTKDTTLKAKGGINNGKFFRPFGANLVALKRNFNGDEEFDMAEYGRSVEFTSNNLLNKIADPARENIVKLFGAGVLKADNMQTHPETGDKFKHEGFYLILEALYGGDLMKLVSMCQDRGGVKESLVRQIGLQGFSALAFAHGVGVAHLDIKEENVMLKNQRGFEACRLQAPPASGKSSKPAEPEVQAENEKAVEPLAAGELKLVDFGLSVNFMGNAKNEEELLVHVGKDSSRHGGRLVAQPNEGKQQEMAEKEQTHGTRSYMCEVYGSNPPPLTTALLPWP